MQRSAGFTLIELSIVLVIIGLVVGGVLVGRDLIHAAEIRAIVAQKEKFDAAVNTFRTKYNCLPGDCPNATDFGMDAGTNGNGDGLIGYCDYNASCTWPNDLNLQWEYVYFWSHLSAANLIADPIKAGPSVVGGQSPGIATPKVNLSSHPFGGNIPHGWLIAGAARFAPAYGSARFAAHSYILGGGGVGPMPGNSTMALYAPADIYAIDAKMDDGLPLSGAVRAFFWDYNTGIGFTPGNPYYMVWPGPNFCIRDDVSPPAYNIPYVGPWPGTCGVVIKAAF